MTPDTARSEPLVVDRDVVVGAEFGFVLRKLQTGDRRHPAVIEDHDHSAHAMFDGVDQNLRVHHERAVAAERQSRSAALSANSRCRARRWRAKPIYEAPASVNVSPVRSSSTIWKPFACTSPASKNLAASISLAKSATILMAAGCVRTGFCQTSSRSGGHSKRLRLKPAHSAFFSAQDLEPRPLVA